MSNETFSISKACFAFKRKSKSHRKTSSSAKKNRLNRSKEEEFLSTAQYLAYQKISTDLENEIDAVQTEICLNLVENIVEYIGGLDSGCQNAIKAIPTVALMTGVNMQDHSVVFGALLEALNNNRFEHVVHLKSNECSDIKKMMEIVVSTLKHSLQTDEESSDESKESFIDDGSDEDEMFNKTSRRKKTDCTMSALASLYSDWRGNRKNSELEAEEKLIVVIDDIEKFVPNILTNFILSASEYLSQLPWIFVFGVSTTLSAIHRLLPQNVSKDLCIKSFQAPLSTFILGRVVDKVLMTEKFPFKLDSKCYELLIEIFLCHDLSVSAFKTRLKFCIMEHFCSSFISSLCCAPSDLKDRIKNLGEKELEIFKRVPSFMKYVETRPPFEQRILLLDSTEFTQCLFRQLNLLHEHHHTFFTLIFSLHQLSNSLPNAPLGKLSRELYGKCLKDSFFEDADYIQTIKLMRILSRQDMQETIEKCVATLDNINSKAELVDFKTQLETYVETLKHWDERCKSVSPKKQNLNFDRTKMKRDEFLKQIKNSHSSKKSAYENLRNEIVDFLDEAFKDLLKSPVTFPFHEILYFSNIESLKQQFVPSIRKVIHRALNDPQHYLGCSCCELETEATILPSMPDICIIYKLHLESGRFLNLYDLLQAFVAIIESSEMRNKKKKKTDKNKEDKEVDEYVQARFLKSLAELQHLGFINSTKRKTDHIQRLTWDN